MKRIIEGIRVYKLTKQIPQYKNWPFQKTLEKRIQNAQQNVKRFQQPIVAGKKYKDEAVMFIHSSISCVVCHQKSDAALNAFKVFDLKQYKIQNNIYGSFAP